MFDIGLSELLLVAILAIMLYGGELPDVARKAGQTMRKLRGAADDLKRQMTSPTDPELSTLIRDIDPRRELTPAPPAPTLPALPAPAADSTPPAAPGAPMAPTTPETSAPQQSPAAAQPPPESSPQ
jgi:Sec-independent protein translocase protein TatA